MKVYQRIARKLNWNPPQDSKFVNQRLDEIEALNKLLPHGSGINAKCEINQDNFKVNQFTINSEYHHMDENGYYAGWFGFDVIVKASLQWGYEIDIKLTYNDTELTKVYIKDLYFDYLGETFHYTLGQDYKE